MMDSCLNINNLMPTPEMLFQAAYGSLVGDPAFISWGVHKGSNTRRVDMMGLTKETVYDAAIHGDMAFFKRLHGELTANPWQFPPSLRTLIPKDEIDTSKGTRPIDDPCELKRLVAICVRHEIEVLAERFMHPGQFGGRPTQSIKPACLRHGATMQDHVATSIWQGIREGYGHVLVLDLKDAFGLLPERAALKVLRDIGLDDDAARWVWRLCRIDAVDARNRKFSYTREGRGIEQGNVLSATIMNVVLAPILKCLEQRLHVRVFSYLDDIYVLAGTDETAREAFYRFRQSARDRGFTNVRRLKKETDPVDSKNSTIIDVNIQPVAVLKTYEVDALGISLRPDKATKLRREGKLVGKVSISTFRKLSNCMSLTKGACRKRNSDAIQPAPSGPVNTHLTETAPAGVVEWFNSLPFTYMNTEARDLSVNTTVYSAGVIPGAPTGLPGNLRNPELHGPHRKVNSESAGTGLSGVRSPEGEGTMSSQCHGADGIPENRDSFRLQGVTTPDRMRNGAGDRRAFLSIRSPDILPNIFCPGRLAFGNKYKTSILDLTKLAPVIGNEVAVGSIVQGINRLIRMVRLDNQAEVRIDPMEAWTAIPTILGNAEDAIYTRKSFKFQNDGTVIIVLVAQTLKREPGKSDPVPQEADVVVRSIRIVDRANHCYKITLAVHGKVCTGFHDSSSPNDTVGALEALAYVLNRFPDSLLAVAVDVVPLLQDPDRIEPSNVGIRRAIELVLKHRKWTREGNGWYLGRPSVGR